MSALATGANFVLIPENPPDTDEWAASMCRVLEAGRAIGRRSNIVIVAEGAQDMHGNPITAQQVRHVLEEQSGEDTRVTSLGHVQRGGAPSAFDRYLSTVLGYAAVHHVCGVSRRRSPADRHSRPPDRELSVDGERGEDEIGCVRDRRARLRSGNGDARRQLPRVLPDDAHDGARTPSQRSPASGALDSPCCTAAARLRA